jgi:hypothetical protein
MHDSQHVILPPAVLLDLERWRQNTGHRLAALYQTPWGASLETRGFEHTLAVHASAYDCKVLEARYPDLAKFIKGS